MTDLPPLDDEQFNRALQAKAAADLAAAEAAAHARTPAIDASDAGVKSRGCALAVEMTSPGGPWGGLPDGVQNLEGDVALVEANKRLACVEMGRSGEALVFTFDGGADCGGDLAEKVRGFAHISKAGRKVLDTHADKLAFALSIGNSVAYGGADPQFWVAEFADQE